MRTVLLCLVVTNVANALIAADPDPVHLEFFETKIRTVLMEHCGECHSGGSSELS